MEPVLDARIETTGYETTTYQDETTLEQRPVDFVVFDSRRSLCLFGFQYAPPGRRNDGSLPLGRRVRLPWKRHLPGSLLL